MMTDAILISSQVGLLFGHGWSWSVLAFWAYRM